MAEGRQPRPSDVKIQARRYRMRTGLWDRLRLDKALRMTVRFAAQHLCHKGRSTNSVADAVHELVAEFERRIASTVPARRELLGLVAALEQ